MKFNYLKLMMLANLIVGLLTMTACNQSSDSLEKKEPKLVLLAEQGNTKKIKELLALGQDTNVLDSCQWNPLMKAAQNGHIDIVKLLLTTNINIENGDKGDYTALLLASSNNHFEIVKLLLAHGANINHQETTMGWTALIWATKLKHLESVDVLIKNGADTEIMDLKGNTALAWAKKIKARALIPLFKNSSQYKK